MCLGNSYFWPKLIQMGIPKVLGAIFIVLSTLVGITVTFLYWNSSAYIDYNTGANMNLLERMTNSGILVPYIICTIFFVLGFFLSRDRVLDHH